MSTSPALGELMGRHKTDSLAVIPIDDIRGAVLGVPRPQIGAGGLGDS